MQKKYFPKGEKVVDETWRIQRGLSGSDVYLETSEGYVIKDEHGYVELTAEGKKIAKKVYARHLLLEEFLERIGVSPETANHDTCRMEHTISEESFRKIQELVKKIKKENASNEQM
ncbi:MULTISPECIES: metal-dependent transcriptional regulator [unclassified Coprococcus]|uniref:metal-dependent transcriptional regulator n=1 Tax=unclassified Coprococcus TaxID=2684943 RepID=UPI0022DECDB6|nr:MULTISPECIES: iron dependent repressor, metal binding and dimerization domain protein [unclassified Coprococcus]